MIYRDLQSFMFDLERTNELVRIKTEVDPVEEITIIQHKVMESKGPALLFENVKGSKYPVVTNLFGTPARVTKAFGRFPREIGEEIVSLFEKFTKPGIKTIWKNRSSIWKVLHTGLSICKNGEILNLISEPPDLNELPVLKCWPLDGGHFFTLPLVHTVDPVTGIGNLGIYRLQRFDSQSTGMHWQIEKGGGFHFAKSVELNQPLSISVILGGPPALILAAIAPLPEGVDERLLASFILGEPLRVIERTSGHKIPAAAEFVLEGTVTPGDIRREGPFGDHLGHYSHSADFPVFRVQRILSRKNPVYPATVVGKPLQEDYFIGEALQEFALPILKFIKPGIKDLWAYPETGFHPLAVMSVNERYPHEALKYAFHVLGEGQLSLTKTLIVVDEKVNVRDFISVSNAVYRYFDAHDSLYLISPSSQDTLDFTGPAMNEGSKLIIFALKKDGRAASKKDLPLPEPHHIHNGIKELSKLGDGFLIVKRREFADKNAIREAIINSAVRSYPFNVMISADVELNDTRQILWGWFTRFDPYQDITPARKRIVENRLIFDSPLSIDAEWKKGYRRPVEFDPERLKEVGRKWKQYGI